MSVAVHQNVTPEDPRLQHHRPYNSYTADRGCFIYLLTTLLPLRRLSCGEEDAKMTNSKLADVEGHGGSTYVRNTGEKGHTEEYHEKFKGSR